MLERKGNEPLHRFLLHECRLSLLMRVMQILWVKIRLVLQLDIDS